MAHLTSMGTWIGMDVIMGVLVFTARFSADTATVALCYQALPLVFWPMLASAVICLVSGLGLGLASGFGVLRFWWVVVKLGLNLLLMVLITVLLRPNLDLAADYGRDLADGTAAAVDLGDLVFPPIVSTTALLLATVISVYKPWGRLRRSQRRSNGRLQPAV